jgi:hypothetical protein
MADACRLYPAPEAQALQQPFLGVGRFLSIERRGFVPGIGLAVLAASADSGSVEVISGTVASG